MLLRALPVFSFVAASIFGAVEPGLRQIPMEPLPPYALHQKGGVDGEASDLTDPTGDVDLQGVTPFTPIVKIEQGLLGAETPAWILKTTLPLWLFEQGTQQWSVESYQIGNGNATRVDTVGPGTLILEQGSTLFDMQDAGVRGDLDLLGAHAQIGFGTNVTSFVNFSIYLRGPISSIGDASAAFVIRLQGARQTEVQIDAFRGRWWESIYGFGSNVVATGPHYDIVRGRGWIEGSDFRFELTLAGPLPSAPNPDLGIPEYQWVFNGSQRVIRYTSTGQFGGWEGTVAGNAQAPLTISHSGSVITGRVPLSALGLGTGLQWAAYTDARIEKFAYAPFSTNILDSVPDSGYGDTDTPAPPVIRSFTASPTRVSRGTSVSLLWSTASSDSVSIGGVGTFGASGGTTVTPQETTTYVMTASGPGGSARSEVRVVVITEPIVAVLALPEGMLQEAGGSAGQDSFVLTNAGGGPESIVMTPAGGFFTIDPPSLSLAPGASRTIQIASSTTSTGEFLGSVRVEGTNQVLNVPVRLLVVAPPQGTVDPEPQTRRVDVSAAAGGTPSGAVVFANRGSAILQAVAVSSVPWIVPQTAPVTIPPGGSATVTFTIDRSLREATGAAIGSLSLRYFQGGSGKGRVGAEGGTSATTTTVRVIDTVTPVATTTGIPSLSPGEVRLLLTGVGHLVGSVGTFLSDVAFTNLGTGNLSDIESFFRPSNAGQPTLRAGLGTLAPSQPVTFSDIIAKVYGYESHSGTLHVRTGSPVSLSLVGTVLAVSDPRGNYGTTIPVLRSDRGVAAGDRSWIPGVQSDDTVHTNLYLQETAGKGATAVVTSHRADGTEIGSQTESLESFGMRQLQRVAPAGASYFVVRNDAASAGELLAYATPVDRGSGDTWSYTDWPRLLGYDAGQPMLIPIAGTVRGANDTFFRTGAGVVNAGNTTSSATFLYRDRSGSTLSRTLTLAAGEAYETNDLLGTLFGIPDQAIGHVVVTPASGRWVVNTRTYTTSPGSSSTYGSASPTLSLSSSIGRGESRRFGAIEDAAAETIGARMGTTYRTNLGLIETSGAAATVRVTMQYAYPASTTVTARGAVSRDYTLPPNGFLLLNRISNELMGETVRNGIGDLTGLVLDMLVMDGEGRVATFTSSVDNGTGDSILRVE